MKDVADLFSRVDVGTRVVVLAEEFAAPRSQGTGSTGDPGSSRNAQARSVTPPPSSGRQAMNLSMSSLY